MDTDFLTKTAVVLPALDEEETVAACVRQWLALDPALVRVVDNGSTDATAAHALAAGAEVRWEPRRGYGAAAWRGTRELPPEIEWILFASTDGSDYLDAASIAAYASAVESGAVLVVGDRVSRPDAAGHLTRTQRLGNALCCHLIALGWDAPRFRDIGSLRLVKRGPFEAMRLRDRAFGWNIEMQVAAIELGLGIAEVEVGYRPRLAGEAKISGNWRGVLRAGRDILSTLAKLWIGKRSRRAERRLREQAGRSTA